MVGSIRWVVLWCCCLVLACGGDGGGTPGPGVSSGPGGSPGASQDGSGGGSDGGNSDADGGGMDEGSPVPAGDGGQDATDAGVGDGGDMGDAGEHDAGGPPCDPAVTEGCDVVLQALTHDVGTLVPAFTPLTTSYVLDLGIVPADFTLTVRAADGLAIEFDGEPTPSGAAIGPLTSPALGGELDVTIAVSDGAFTREYSVRVRRIWRQSLYGKADNRGPTDRFGFSVATDGQRVVVGANEEGSDATGVDGDGDNDDAPRSGAAYVFARTGGDWKLDAYLKASNAQQLDAFGSAVAIDGDLLVVGAPQESSNATGVDGNQLDNSTISTGAAYVFRRSGGSWVQEAYLKPSAPMAAGDWFGTSVAISGDVIVVGSHLEDSEATGVDGNDDGSDAPGSGAAHVFRHDGDDWQLDAYLKASNTDGGDGFGTSVAISGDVIVVGAPGEDSTVTGVDSETPDNDGALDSGAAYVFRYSGTAWLPDAYLKADNTGADDAFGCSVALDGDRIAVGACDEASNATGVDGDGANDMAVRAGAAYLYHHDGADWLQDAYLKASNTQPGDGFGRSVALDGDVALVGAFSEAGANSGVNPDSMLRGAENAGAAYVYRRGAVEWAQEAYLKPNTTRLEDARFGWSAAAADGMLVLGARDESGGGRGVNPESTAVSGTSGAVFVFE